MDKFNLASRLKMFREKSGLTPKELSANASIPYSTYMKYEGGKASPPISSIIAIAKTLHVSVNDLIGYTEFCEDTIERYKKDLTNIGCKVIQPESNTITIEYEYNNGTVQATFDKNMFLITIGEALKNATPAVIQAQKLALTCAIRSKYDFQIAQLSKIISQLEKTIAVDNNATTNKSRILELKKQKALLDKLIEKTYTLK